ncbi:MAG: sugar phosphate nucleotidyltransferase [Candidatus Limnocylindrales bacterium]|jgi:phosphomannomutase
MAASTTVSGAQRKAIILAAGNDDSRPHPLLLARLGDHTILDLVIDNVLQVVAPEDIYIVVGRPEDKIRRHLGECYTYVVQDEPAGTGHAVLQVGPKLAGFKGDLLILYGDTPLFRSASLRGLLNRHQLKGADLTLLTAIVDRPLPYGRIRRDDEGHIRNIVEASDATPDEQAIREFNVGAYVGRAESLFATLESMGAAGENRLTDAVDCLSSSGKRVESYQIYDEDEIQGINSEADLRQAEFILQKRLFRPHRNEEQNQVAFGTGGWRAIIGEGFTFHNVRRLSQAIANEVTRRGIERQGVLIGFDRRFLSRQAAQASAEVFAGNNIPVTLIPEDVPTPLVTFATPLLGSAYGLIFTASHNPPEWNGLKVFKADGSLPMEDETRRYEDETNALSESDVIKLELDLARKAGMVVERDFSNAYIDNIEKIVDVESIRSAGLKIIVDPMYGTSQLTLGTILSDARCRVTFIHERHNPLFGGRSPAPDLKALQVLITSIRDEGHYDLGMATDGDADRIAIVDERGEYISTNDLLLLIYWYLHEVRGLKGGVVRNLSTTHLLDRLARALGEECYEVPVGFKHVTAAMLAHDALLGGESSGGLTVRGYLLGKDGIFACALVVEMLARTGKRISELLETVTRITGRLFQLEANIPSTPEMRIEVPRRLKEAPLDMLGKYKVQKTTHYDGTKIFLENDNWALMRFSGTEPVLRLTVEADSPEKATELLDWLRGFVTARA